MKINYSIKPTSDRIIGLFVQEFGFIKRGNLYYKTISEELVDIIYVSNLKVRRIGWHHSCVDLSECDTLDEFFKSLTIYLSCKYKKMPVR